MRAKRARGVAVALVVGALAVHCGSDDAKAPAPGTVDAGIVDGAQLSDGTAFSDALGPTITSLTIDPPSATLVVTDLNAAAPSAPFTAKATYSNGSTAVVPASWVVDRYDIASISSGGVASASRGAYGTAKLTATVEGGASANATLTVSLATKINGANASAANIALLDAATSADTAVTSFAYPYDKTVFPRGLLAPEQMWNGGAADDLYRLRITAASFDVSVFTKADPPSRYTLPQSLWDALGATAKGGTVNVELRRASGGAAYVSATQTWTIADANLRGSIYYWSIGEGRIVKLDVSTGQRSAAFPSGPATALGSPAPSNASSPESPPWDANGANDRCVACHAVSKDGSRLGAVFSRRLSRGPIGTVTLANQAITAVGDYQSSVQFTALTPDGALLVENDIDAKLRLVDANTATPLASALDATTSRCHPVFSPDGKRFAVVSDCTGNSPPVEFDHGHLELWDFDPATKAFSNASNVVLSAGASDAIAYPSFTPDSKHVVVQRGNYSRAKYGTDLHGSDDLFIVDLATKTSVALDNANGKDVLSASNLHLNYAPTVNPVAEGGYVWIVFTSPRDYGNRMVSPIADVTYGNRKQLWVAAIDVSGGATDPSHPAFFLPGQDPATANMFGYWALSPCKPSNASAPPSCAAGYECCSGFCRDTGSGPVCVDAPTGCHQVGEKCGASGDCCDPTAVSCVAGICQKQIR